MNKIALYDQVCLENSQTITKRYSTSFSSSIRLLHPKMRLPISGIYGFVRLADEIVDTFFQTNQVALFEKFKQETYDALENRFSINPVIHAFQLIVHQYNIQLNLIESFFKSMELDLHKKSYNNYEEYAAYIYGSAEVVGLMCLPIMCEQNEAMVKALTPTAKCLGSAFQKINFLRDIQEDFNDLNRVYFPNIDFEKMDDYQKNLILLDIEKDFEEGLKGIQQLPMSSRFGVYVAYKYYKSLFHKIKKMPAKAILQKRVRVPDINKILIVFESYFRLQLNAII